MAVYELQTPDIELVFSGIVAAATGGLAVATWWLARKTREVAEKTGVVANETRQLAAETTDLAKRTGEDVEAQFRPAIVVDNHHERPEPVTYRPEAGLTLRIRHSGHGPALDIKAIAQPGSRSAVSWNRGAIPTESSVWLEFNRQEGGPDGRVTVELEYRGLSKDWYLTTISVNCEAAPFVEDVVITPVDLPESAQRA